MFEKSLIILEQECTTCSVLQKKISKVSIAGIYFMGIRFRKMDFPHKESVKRSNPEPISQNVYELIISLKSRENSLVLESNDLNQVLYV